MRISLTLHSGLSAESLYRLDEQAVKRLGRISWDSKLPIWPILSVWKGVRTPIVEWLENFANPSAVFFEYRPEER